MKPCFICGSRQSCAHREPELVHDARMSAARAYIAQGGYSEEEEVAELARIAALDLERFRKPPVGIKRKRPADLVKAELRGLRTRYRNA